MFKIILDILVDLDKKSKLTKSDARLIVQEVDKFFNELENSQISIDIYIDICKLISSIRSKFNKLIGADKKNGYANVQDLIDFRERLKGYFNLPKYKKIENDILRKNRDLDINL
jgi:hypothetical protein